MAKVSNPLHSVYATGSVGRSTIYFKPRQIAPGIYTYTVETCKGKLTRYSKQKIYGPGGKGERVAKYWKIWGMKQRQWYLLKKCKELYA